jgi:hypothetical protein
MLPALSHTAINCIHGLLADYFLSHNRFRD